MMAAKPLALLLGALLAGLLAQIMVYNYLDIYVAVQDYALGYGLNFVMAALILIALLRLPHRYEASLGYFFMFGSFFKFIVYFLVFLPRFNANGGVTKPLFFLFFVPYLLALVVETSVLIIKQNQKN